MPDNNFTIEYIKQENLYYYQHCKQFGLEYALIDDEYDIDRYCGF